MAYLFNALSDEAGEQGKQNIFGGQQTDQGTTSGGAGEAFQKSEAPGGGGTAGGGGGGTKTAAASTPTKQTMGGYNPQAQSQAYGAAAQSMKLPTRALTQAEGTLAKGSQELQDQANAYSRKAQETAKTYSLDEATLAGAAEGKGPEYQKTQERLRQTDPGQSFESFQGLSQLPSVQNLRDPGSLFRAESGPGYTAGQSRLDAALLRRNPEFIKRQQELLAKEKALREQSQKTGEEKTKEAREMLGQEFGRSTEAIRGRLGGLSEEIITAAKQKETAEDLRRAGLDPAALAAAEQEKIKAQIREDLSKADPRSEQFRALKYLSDQYDVAPYASIDRDTDWREFIGAPEAQKYNRLQGLLGTDQMLTPGTGPGAESEFKAQDAYRKILEGIQGKRRAQDVKSKEEIDKIIAAQQGRAKQLGEADTAQNAKDAAMKQLIAYARAKYGENPNLADVAALNAQQMLGAFGGPAPDVSPYIRENTGSLDWRGYLDPATASRLNELTQDIGGIETYQGGQYRPEIDMQGLADLYEKTYGESLGRQRQQYAAPPPPPAKGGSGKLAQTKRQSSTR